MRKYRNRVLAGFIIVIIIYAGLLLFVNTDDLLSQLTIYPWELLIPVVALKFIAWAFRFWEWQYFLGIIGARDKITWFDSLVLYISGYTMAVSPGKIAEVLKSVILKAQTGVPFARSAPVVIAERVVDGVAVVIVVTLIALILGDQMELGNYSWLILISGVLLTLGLIAIQIRSLAEFFLNLAGKLPLIKRIQPALAEFYESSREILSLRHVIPTTLMGAAAHLVDGIGFTIMLSGFGLEITWILFLQATFIVGLAAAIGALSGLPNGAGVTEVGTTGMLLLIVAPANPLMTPVVAPAAALLEGFFHKWFRVFAGLIVTIVFRRRLFPETLEADIAEMEAERAAKHQVYNTESTPA